MIIILEKAKALYSHIHENVFKIMFYRTGSTLTFTFIIAMIFILDSCYYYHYYYHYNYY